MRRIMVLFMVLGISCALAQAQTDTPTPSETATVTPTNTPTPEPWVYATLSPIVEGEDGQIYRFDYTYTVGDVMISVLLTLLVFSVWALIVLMVIVGNRR